MNLPCRTAVFSGDAWHPAATIRRGLEPLAKDGYLFEWREDPAAWRAPLAGYPLAILAKGNTTSPDDRRPWLTPDTERTFSDHVRDGGSLLVIHAGTAGYRENARLRGVIGGAFLQHPPPCPVEVEPTAGKAIADGVEPFTLLDEHYFVELDDASAEVFLHTRSEHGLQPAGWTRREGKGFVCVLTPGHYEEVWVHPAFQTLLRNALRQAVGPGRFPPPLR